MKKTIVIFMVLLSLLSVTVLAAPMPLNEKTVEVKNRARTNGTVEVKDLELFKVCPDKKNNLIIEHVSTDETVCKRLWLITWRKYKAGKFEGSEPVYAIMDDRSLKNIGKYKDIYSDNGRVDLKKIPIDSINENYYWTKLEPSKGMAKITVITENLEGKRTIKSMLINTIKVNK